MTAEIAILNKEAVAMAADSAVTLANAKVVNSANKIFALSRTDPVGIMFYSSAQLLHVPWESIVKIYREANVGVSRAHLTDWAIDFRRFLCDNSLLLPTDVRKEGLRQYFAQFVRWFWSVLEKHVKAEYDKQGSIAESKIVAISLGVLGGFEAGLVNLEFESDLSKDRGDELSLKYAESAREFTSSIPIDRMNLPRDFGNRLAVLASNFLLKSPHFPEGLWPSSGIVIAGFGAQDVFPSLDTVEMSLVTEDTPIYHRPKDKSTSITHSNRAAVLAFAQAEMVQLFMNGVDSEYLAEIRAFLDRFIDELPVYISVCSDSGDSDTKRALQTELEKRLFDFKKELDDTLFKVRNERFSSPILEMLAILPKVELASMAESLVSLTSLKRRVTRSQETVGGPIDVALVSRGDGLIWVKRKHYFDPSLNQQFMAKLFRS